MSKNNNGKCLKGFRGYIPSGDKIKANLLQSGATADQLDNVLWLVNYGRANHVTSIRSLAKRTNVSSTPTLSRVLAGKYGASLENINTAITEFRNAEKDRKSVV